MRATQGPAPVAWATGDQAREALAQQMVPESGYEGADIERVLKAYQSGTKQPGDQIPTSAP